jgi:MFS family permease
MSVALARARRGTTAVFFLTGALYASWAARIPAVQERLDLSPGEFALALLALEGGAVVGLPVGGALSSRLGSRRSIRIAFVAYPASLAAAGVAGGLAELALAVAAMSAATSVVDVAMNVQGIELERRYGRPVMASLHAGHSFGVLAGGALGTCAAAAGIAAAEQLVAVAAIGLVAGQLASRPLLRDGRSGGPLVARPDRAIAGLGALAFLTFLLDATGANWSAAQVHDRGASSAVAAAGFTAFALAMALGRLGGDRVVARLGRVRAVRLSGVVAGAGGAVVVASPGVGAAIAGWTLFGAGVAGLAPALLGAVPQASSQPAPVAVAAVTSVGYLGSFTGPPLVGALAGGVGLSPALGLTVVGGLLVACLAGVARPRA